MKHTLLCVLVGLAACGESTPAPVKQGTPAPPEPATKSETEDAPKKRAEPPKPPPELEQADALGSAGAKAEKSMGFKIAPLTGLYALAGSPAAASWGAPSDSDPNAIRDDDLRTTWTCETSGDKKCAVGIGFEASATVKAIRFFGAAGPNWRDYKGSGRVKKVRVHTDGGHYDLSFKDGAQHHYVVFDSAVETQTLTLEVLEVHKGKKTQAAHIAELEVYGSSGPKRDAIDLDPQQMFVTFETEAWKEGGSGGSIRLAFLEDAEGTPIRRLMRATAIFGNKGDRYLLIEKLFGTDCSTYNGSYILLDQQTRMYYPLGKLSGMAGSVYRHGAGLGFAVVGPDGDPANQRAITLEGDELKIRRPSRKSKDDAAAAREDWGTTEGPLRRGPEPLPKGCVGGQEQDAKLDALVELDGFDEIDPRDFMVCEVGDGAVAILGSSPACSRSWIIAVVDPDGEIRQQLRPKKEDGRGLRVASYDQHGLIVEATKKNGASSDLLKLGPEEIETWQKGAAFVVRAPGSCHECSDELLAPGEPEPAVVPDEGAPKEAEPEPDPLPQPDP